MEILNMVTSHPPNYDHHNYHHHYSILLTFILLGTMRYPKEDKFGRTIYKGCFGSDGKQGIIIIIIIIIIIANNLTNHLISYFEGGTGKLEYSNGMSYGTTIMRTTSLSLLSLSLSSSLLT